MDLSIKDPEAHRLAKLISQTTGDTLTKVVIDSLRDRQERLENRRTKATAEELMAIARRAARGVKRPYIDHGELLYDKDGLPK